MKIAKFERKNTLFGYFWARILKNYRHINIVESVKLQNFVKKWNLSKFGTKNALLRIFWAGI